MQPPEPRQDHYLTLINRLAITQLVLGSLCLINGIVIYIIYGFVMVYRGGLVEIWTEIWFIVAGATGIAVKTKQRCNLHMGFCIVATVMAAILTGEAGYFAIPKRYGYLLVFSGAHIPIFLFAAAEFFISIMASVYCCRVRPDTVTTVVTGQVYPQATVAIQQGYVPQGGAVMMAPDVQHEMYYGAQPPTYPGHHVQLKA